MKFRHIFVRIPFIGQLALVRGYDVKEAFVEVGVNVTLSTMPIWLGAIFLLADTRTEEHFFDFILINLKSGELFIYATALLGPLFYFVLKEFAGSDQTPIRQFPSRRAFTLMSIAIAVISASLFSFQRGMLYSEGSQYIDKEFLFKFSLILYIFSVFFVYLAHVYKNYLESGAAHESRSQTRDFVDSFMGSRDG